MRCASAGAERRGGGLCAGPAYFFWGKKLLSFGAWYRKGDAVLGCVFYSLPSKALAGGFAEGRMYERALVLWIREQSGICHDLNYNRGGAGRTPKNVATCGGSAWFTGGPTEVV